MSATIAFSTELVSSGTIYQIDDTSTDISIYDHKYVVVMDMSNNVLYSNFSIPLSTTPIQITINSSWYTLSALQITVLLGYADTAFGGIALQHSYLLPTTLNIQEG